jgi:hypothetical protein
VPGQLVAGIVEDPQEGEQVLHVGALEEPQPSVLDERDVAPGQLELKPVAVVPGAEQHGLLVEGNAALAVLEHAVAHEARLGQLVDARGEGGPAAGRPAGPQLLGVALAGTRHHRVGAGEDGRRGAVVAVEGDDRGPREAVRELDHVARGARPEPVDRLGVVTDRRHAGAGAGHGVDDVGLHGIGVLELVDQDVVEPRPQDRAGSGRRGQRPPVQEQVVVVDDVVGPLAFDVAGEDALDPVEVVPAPRERPLDDVGELLLGVDHPRVDRRQRVLPGEAAAPLAETEVVADEAQQVGVVGLVEDGEPGTQADGGAVLTEQAVGHRVEGAPPNPAGALGLGQLAGPGDHLPRGAPREGEQEDAFRPDAAPHEAGDPAGEGAGLAAPGAGDDQQVASVVQHGRSLVGVQVVEPGKHLFDPTGPHPVGTVTAPSPCSIGHRPLTGLDANGGMRFPDPESHVRLGPAFMDDEWTG